MPANIHKRGKCGFLSWCLLSLLAHAGFQARHQQIVDWTYGSTAVLKYCSRCTCSSFPRGRFSNCSFDRAIFHTQPQPTSKTEEADVQTEVCSTRLQHGATLQHEGPVTAPLLQSTQKAWHGETEWQEVFAHHVQIGALLQLQGVVGGLYCRTHKLDSMVNVVKGSCEFESCNKRPIFNNPGATGGRYCSAHAEPGMVDVNSKKCGHVGCSTVPVFNFRGASVGCYCNTHKLQSMVDVANKRCEYDGCHSRAVGYRSGSSQRRLCAMHKRSQG